MFIRFYCVFQRPPEIKPTNTEFVSIVFLVFFNIIVEKRPNNQELLIYPVQWVLVRKNPP